MKPEGISDCQKESRVSERGDEWVYRKGLFFSLSFKNTYKVENKRIAIVLWISIVHQYNLYDNISIKEREGGKPVSSLHGSNILRVMLKY